MITMNKLNVWIVTSEFPPMYGGGISTYCNDASLAWASCGHEVKVITTHDSVETTVSVEQLGPKLQLIRVPVWTDKKVERYLGYAHLAAYSLAEEIINTIKHTSIIPDFIEVQDYDALGYFLLKKKLLLAPELRNTKIIIFAHTPFFEVLRINQAPTYLLPDYWIGQCEKFCLKGADAVLSPSNFLKKRLAKYASQEIDVIPSPLIGYTEEQVKEFSMIQPEYDCIYVGRLECRKGTLQLLSAFKKIWDSGSNLRLRTVGGDTFFVPKNISLKSYIEKEYAGYIESGLLTLSDRVPSSQVPATFFSAKIVIIPSIYENFPYVCMQAMNLARVLLVSSSGGQAEMVGVDRTCGSIFCWEEEDSFQKELYALIEKSPAELALIGSNARKKINEMCGPKTFVEKRVEHFKKIAAAPGANTLHYPFLNKIPLLEPIAFNDYQSENREIKGRVSIIIPFYNLGQFLPDTISSVEASSYLDKEILVINDGSTDVLSLQVLQEIQDKNTSIQIINIKNAGLANARNIGAKVATGEFIAFLDADDCVEPKYYEKCVEILNTYKNTSFVYSWVKYFGESDHIWVNFDTELPYMLAANMLAPLQVVRRRDFLEFGINDKEMIFGMEDYEAWLRMVGHGKFGVSIPEVMVKYRQRKDSMSKQFKPNTILYMYEQIAAKNSRIYQEYGNELFMLLNANGPGFLWSNATQSQARDLREEPPKNALDQLSCSEIARLKRITTSPLVVGIIRLLLLLKVERLFKFRNKH